MKKMLLILLGLSIIGGGFFMFSPGIFSQSSPKITATREDSTIVADNIIKGALSNYDAVPNGSSIEKEFYNCSAPIPYVILDFDMPVGKTSLSMGQCQVEVAKKIDSVATCGSFTNSHLQEDCIRAVAVAKNNMHLCDGSGKGFMSEEQEKSQKIFTTTSLDQIRQCYSDFGLLTNQVEACDAIPIKTYGAAYQIAKNNCYGNIAIHTKNKELCKKIDEDFLKNKCVNEIMTVK